ncbi:hypothetical protein AB0A69_16285 [Streptomyces sp. NPDC045431]|uniref:hypothetical protein n=1 Tax=Streptomyces sp. NPDC045431 TaxID=3155613 RepID=UPI0033EB5940
MSPRRLLPPPPPPPPPHLRTWPDRAALLADRNRAMGELTWRIMGGRRLVLFLLTLAGLQAGWLAVGGALMSLEDGLVDPLMAMAGALGVCLGLAVVIPAVFAVAFAVRRDRVARELLAQWASLDSDPPRDAAFRVPVLGLIWFLLSFALCASGLWLCFAVPASARPGSTTYAEVAALMGVGLILWVHGLIAVTKAVGHYRWAVRLGARRPQAVR